jgi:hypothetical protein
VVVVLACKELNQDMCSSMMKRQQLEKGGGKHAILTEGNKDVYAGVFPFPHYQNPLSSLL